MEGCRFVEALLHKCVAMRHTAIQIIALLQFSVSRLQIGLRDTKTTQNIIARFLLDCLQHRSMHACESSGLYSAYSVLMN